MRFSLPALALANAANSEHPVISLDLPANKQTAKWSTMTSNLPAGGDYAHYRPVDSRNSMTAGHYSGPRNSFADECEVKTPAFIQNVFGMPINVAAVDPACQEPRAAAFDHHDGDITTQLTTTYTMFVQSNVKSMPTRPGDSLSSPGTVGLSAVDFGQRGEFVINYDVSDSTGNNAEQVEFAMILVDEVAPFFVNSPQYMHTQNVRAYEYDATHCTSNADCRALNAAGQTGVVHNRNIKKYLSYMNEIIPDGTTGNVAKTQTNVVIELCGDLGSPAIEVGDTVRNLYWQNEAEPITAYDDYDGLLNAANSPMSIEARKTANQGLDDSENGTPGVVAAYEPLDYKIDVFEYNGHIDDWFHHDGKNKDLGGKVRTIAKRDMKYPIDRSTSAQACLTEMQTGQNAVGTTFWTDDQLQINAVAGRDANGNDVDLAPAFNTKSGGVYNCDFNDQMTKYWDETQWAAWKTAGADPEAMREELRLNCVHCIKAYREYLFDSSDSRNRFMTPLAGLTAVKNGVLDDPQALLGAAAFTSSCWDNVASHQMENQFCGKPIYRQKHFELKAEDFADIFGLNNQNNKVEEDGDIIFQDSIIPTIVLPTTGQWGTVVGTHNVNAYECGFKITHQEGDEHCTYDAPQTVTPRACSTEADCLGFDGSDDNRCEKPAYGGAGHCKKIGNVKMVNGSPQCEAADGSFPGSYWTQWLAQDSTVTSGSKWAPSYRPNIKYVDCYDSHMKEFNWVKVTDPLNGEVDFDVTSSNWAGAEGTCVQTARADAQLGTAAVGPIVNVLPWRDVTTGANHFRDIFGYTGSGTGSLFAACVTKCEADIARVSGYASGSIAHTGGCAQYCTTLAHYDGFECHSKARSVTLSYDVQDNFGNWAATGTSYVSIVDNIAPTLYITTHEYRAATHEFESVMHCDEHHDERLIQTDGTHVCETGTDCSSTDGVDFIEGHHLVKEHCDNVRFCEDTAGDVHMGAQCQTETMLGQYTMKLDAQGQPERSNTMKYHIDDNSNQMLDQKIIQHSAGYAGDYRWVEELLMEGTGYECWDLCSSTTTTVEWHSSCASDSTSTGVRFDILTPGTFYLKYDCFDEAGEFMDTDMVLKARASMHTTACRTFINVDKTKPVITVFDYANRGDGFYHVEATRDTNYVDAGAACSDMVDGNLNPDVQVSGDVVNMAAVGTYIINYDCEDSAGHRALQAHRTIVVEDTTCPTCSVPGDTDTITVEASFPYSEEGSVCTDNIDGYIGAAKITGTVDIEATGVYVLTYSATDMNSNGNGLSNLACTVNNVHTTKTIVVEDTMVPIISLKYRNSQLLGTSLMAEASATNAWVIGAVASAISGVALLGYAATRKATVSTTVPV